MELTICRKNELTYSYNLKYTSIRPQYLSLTLTQAVGERNFKNGVCNFFYLLFIVAFHRGCNMNSHSNVNEALSETNAFSLKLKYRICVRIYIEWWIIMGKLCLKSKYLNLFWILYFKYFELNLISNNTSVLNLLIIFEGYLTLGWFLYLWTRHGMFHLNFMFENESTDITFCIRVRADFIHEQILCSGK